MQMSNNINKQYNKIKIQFQQIGSFEACVEKNNVILFQLYKVFIVMMRHY